MQAREDALAAFNEDPTLKARVWRRVKDEFIHISIIQEYLLNYTYIYILLQAYYQNPCNLEVILISLKAGGEGLNLQAGFASRSLSPEVANHVFLLDPWWNPACEMQARCL